MRIGIAMILLITSKTGAAQVDTELVNFRKLTGYDSVVILNEHDSTRHTYAYQSGILKKENYVNYSAKYPYAYLTTYIFGPTRNVETRRLLSTVYPGVGNPYKEWRSDYDVTIEKIENNRVDEVLVLRATGTDSTLVEKTIRHYNTKGQLVAEMIHDHSTGFRDVFKSNSAEFGKSYEKTEVQEKTVRYKYEGRHLTIEYILSGEIAGREFVTLNSQFKPIRIQSVTGTGMKLGETVVIYDPKGRLTERRYTWLEGLNLWGEGVDFLSPYIEEISYNDKGLPEKVILQVVGSDLQPQIYTYSYYPR